MAEKFLSKNQSSTTAQSIYLPKLKGLLYKRVDKDKLNVIGGLFMQLRNTWLNSFVSKNLQWSTIHEFTKIDRFTIKNGSIKMKSMESRGFTYN